MGKVHGWFSNEMIVFIAEKLMHLKRFLVRFSLDVDVLVQVAPGVACLWEFASGSGVRWAGEGEVSPILSACSQGHAAEGALPMCVSHAHIRPLLVRSHVTACRVCLFHEDLLEPSEDIWLSSILTRFERARRPLGVTVRVRPDRLP